MPSGKREEKKAIQVLHLRNRKETKTEGPDFLRIENCKRTFVFDPFLFWKYFCPASPRFALYLYPKETSV
jgi:hypothetical protein